MEKLLIEGLERYLFVMKARLRKYWFFSISHILLSTTFDSFYDVLNPKNTAIDFVLLRFEKECEVYKEISQYASD